MGISLLYFFDQEADDRSCSFSRGVYATFCSGRGACKEGVVCAWELVTSMSVCRVI